MGSIVIRRLLFPDARLDAGLGSRTHQPPWPSDQLNSPRRHLHGSEYPLHSLVYKWRTSLDSARANRPALFRFSARLSGPTDLWRHRFARIVHLFCDLHLPSPSPVAAAAITVPDSIELLLCLAGRPVRSHQTGT